VLVLLCIILMGTGLQTAHAELSDDPLPLRMDQCERERDKGKGAEALCNIKTIINFAQEIASYWSGISGTIDAATTVLKLLGILEKSDQAEAFRKLHKHLDQVAVAITWKNDVDARANRLADMKNAVFQADEAPKLHKKDPATHPPFTLAFPGVNSLLKDALTAGDRSTSSPIVRRL
jgi:hypothetical protein